MKTLKRGLIELHRVGGALAGIALGCAVVVPTLIFASAGLAFWVGLLIGLVLAVILLLIYGMGVKEQ